MTGVEKCNVLQISEKLALVCTDDMVL